MSSLMQIDIDQMRSELDVLKNAIEVFQDYVKNGFREEISMVSAMQSDFTSQLERILENIQEKNAAELLENLKCYHVNALGIVDALEKDVDEAMAKQIGGRKNG